MADLRVAVIIPSHNQWQAGFGYALSNMVACFVASKYEGGKKEIEIINVQGSMLPEVRHRCIAEAMKWDATHALWLDCDMMFPRDTLQCLLRHGEPVVGCNYVRRKLPTIPTAHLGNDNGGMLWTREGERGLVEVKHLGMGCLLTDMRVYDYLDLPFFLFEPTQNGAGLIGEDVYFCKKLTEAGFKIYCDQELSWHVGHIGEMVYTHRMGIESKAAAEKAGIKPEVAGTSDGVII
jgi:hypothetical protein